MTLASNDYEAMRLDALYLALRRAAVSIGGEDRHEAIFRLREARRQIDETLTRLDATR